MSRVLVVEDHADTREVLCELLAEMGYVVAGVESAERALRELATNAYDILVVDYWLAGGNTGAWLLEQAAGRRLAVPTIMCTAERFPPHVPAHVTVLTKPIDIGELVQHVERMSKTPPPSRREVPAAMRIDLVLYITASPASLRGLRNLQRFLRRVPPDRFSLKVVNLTNTPDEAGPDVALTPMLVKTGPGLLERLVGDFRDTHALEDIFSRDGHAVV